MRKTVGILAIYAVALHAVLTGLMPLAAVAAPGPLSAICHSAAEDAAGRQDHHGIPKPGHACEHCNLCTAWAPPPAADAPLAGTLTPARRIYPLPAPVRIALTPGPKLARGPPQPM